MPFLTGDTTIQHAMTDARGKGITAMQRILYRIKLTKKTEWFKKL